MYKQHLLKYFGTSTVFIDHAVIGFQKHQLINRGNTSQILTVIEELTFPIICGMMYYYAVDEPNIQFNFEGRPRCGISHDAMLLFWANGWIVVVSDKWFGKIGKRLHIKRVLGYFCLPSQF